jgi:hypothetical protein
MAALVSEEFVVAGEVMASSVAQGGPAPNIMNASSFSYLANGIQSVNTDSVIVEDVLLKTAIDKVCIIFNVGTCSQGCTLWVQGVINSCFTGISH